MSSDIDPDYSIRRNLRQRQKKKCDSIDGIIDLDKNKRKTKKKGTLYGKNTAYDENGNIRSNGVDMCDCINEECDGCWYPCRCCGSEKCGPQCRSNRKFFYEGIIYDGKDLSITNRFVTK